MTIAVDFDGVIHQYRKGWHDGTIYDDPYPGAFKALEHLMLEDAVCVYTTRDVGPVASWLMKRGGFICRTNHPSIFWDVRGELLVTNMKPAAYAYIDDRALRFWNWGQALDELKERNIISDVVVKF